MPPEFRQATIGTREQRFLLVGAAIVTSRATADGGSSPVIEGHGALFNDEAIIAGMFRERILPGAFKESIAQDDIRVAFNHDANFILGRTGAKTASVNEDAKGLKYTATPPDTQAGRDTVISIKRGDISGSSFQFEIVNPDDEDWDFEQVKQGKLPLRTIKRAKVWEVGPVAWPAYENTTVSARAIATVEAARAELAAAEETTPDPVAAPTIEERVASDLKASMAAMERAIARCRRQMDGSEATTDASRQKLMDDMIAALGALDPDHPMLKTDGGMSDGGMDKMAPMSGRAVEEASVEHSDLEMLERELSLMEHDL